MKILIFGRGVISTQYAWAFEKAGHDVTFYVRPGRKAEYGNSVALNLIDARKKLRGEIVQENWSIKMVEDFDETHEYDLIFVSVQHYHIPDVVKFLYSKIGKTTVLFFNNFWEEPLEQTAQLPANQLVFGFPQAGGGFDNKGELNGSILKSVIIGTFKTEASPRAAAVIELFKSAHFKITIHKDFRSWLFGHFVMNAALHIEIIKAGSNMLDAFQSTKHWQNVQANGKELLELLQARNVDLSESSGLKIFKVPPFLMSFFMKIAVKLLPTLRQMLTGHSNEEETKSYARDVLNMAKKLNISLPRYEASESLLI